MVESDDVADLALRTCMCGRRLEGFDDYFEHLRSVVIDATIDSGTDPTQPQRLGTP